MTNLSVNANSMLQNQDTVVKQVQIHGPVFDALFLICPFWFSILYWAAISYFPQQQPLIFLFTYAFLAEAHFGSTWAFYLDAENRTFFSQNKVAFYWVPLLILICATAIGRFMGLATLILAIAPLSAFHITRQSIGIVGLYRAKAKDFEATTRRLENCIVYAGTVLFMGMAFARSLESRFSSSQLLQGSTGEIILGLIRPIEVSAYAAACVAFCCFAALIARDFKKFRSNEKPTSGVRWIILTYSFLLFSPYIFCTRFDDAMAMGVGMHYLQYLGLVWLVNRNRYSLDKVALQKEKVIDWPKRFLVSISNNILYAVLVLFIYGVIMLLIRQGGFDLYRSEPANWLYSIPLALNAVHFHVDRYLWKFSNPYLRANVLANIR